MAEVRPGLKQELGMSFSFSMWVAGAWILGPSSGCISQELDRSEVEQPERELAL